MCPILLALLLQVPQKTAPDILPSTTTTVSPTAKSGAIKSSVQAPPLTGHETSTTPDIGDPFAQETHAQMERDIGTQGSDIGHLRSDVEHLQKQREDPDRKDLDSLIKYRDNFTLICSVLATVIGTLSAVLLFLYGKFGNVVWEDSVRPRLKRYIDELNRQPQP